jgi:hypothetical protein
MMFDRNYQFSAFEAFGVMSAIIITFIVVCVLYTENQNLRRALDRNDRLIDHLQKIDGGGGE